MTLLEAVTGGVLVHGITGRTARRFAAHMRNYGTPVVGGVSAGHGGQEVDGIAVYDTVQLAVAETGASVVVSMLPAGAAADGLMECAYAGIRATVCVAEGVGQHDAVTALQVAEAAGMRVVGPNTAGLLVPDRLSLGFLPTSVALPGRCALLSRSGTLSYEVAHECARAGVGLSVWIGVGGDAVKGTAFVDVFSELAGRDDTDVVVLVGEIGTSDEEEVAASIGTADVDVIALVAGRNAPRGVRLGHAGAFVDRARGGSWEGKVEALRAGGATVVPSPLTVAETAREVLAEP